LNLSVPDKRWVAFIRGINLGPYKKVPMAELRAALEGLGYTDVKTLLQSGNAVFTADGPGTTLEKQLESVIESRFGHDVTVLVRGAVELKKAVAANPFANKKAAPLKELHAAFLSTKVPTKRLSDLDPAGYRPDEIAAGDRVIYLRLPNGFQGSKLPDWEKVLGVRTTVRTWNTVTRLADLV
jgi:uncharacterized protein (DUF1697 family)